MTRLARGRGVEGSHEDEFTRAKEGRKRRNEEHLSYVTLTRVTAAPSSRRAVSSALEQLVRTFSLSLSLILLFPPLVSVSSPARCLPALSSCVSRRSIANSDSRVILTNFLSALSARRMIRLLSPRVSSRDTHYTNTRLDIVTRLNK